MTQYNFSPLKGVLSVQHATVNNQVQDNLIEYFDYALLDKGNYFNVSLGETDYNGEDFSRLRPARSEVYPSGHIWEGFRKNWVWQSGLAPSGKEPPIVGTNPMRFWFCFLGSKRVLKSSLVWSVIIARKSSKIKIFTAICINFRNFASSQQLRKIFNVL